MGNGIRELSINYQKIEKMNYLEISKSLENTKTRMAKSRELNGLIVTLCGSFHEELYGLATEIQGIVDWINKEKEYTVSFDPSGWNTVWARDNESAMEAAKQKYPDIPISAVRLAESSDIESVVLNRPSTKKVPDLFH